jgi:hypothetical protein
MKVKNIRIFREFVKSNVYQTNDPNRNPHFAGATIDNRNFGFFQMLNGLSPIQNLLETILSMAADSQAIYEFMQNAVDAGSENLLMTIIDDGIEKYLIVLNDGEYFSARSVLSILSIGSSSKYRNPNNIGKYGIGFKLAHRLIGEGNSLNELINENKGPILFSWNNGELKNLDTIKKKQIQLIEPELNGYGEGIESNNFDPWLFKIIATNFPCLHDDPVVDALGREHETLFTDNEFEVLRNISLVLKKNYQKSDEFESGSLLIIPLTNNKSNILKNIPVGLDVSATILSNIDRNKKELLINIDENEIRSDLFYTEYLEFEDQIINNENFINPNEHIEIMFIYSNKIENNPFESKPQLYKYFPMSSEVHGFCFAIHCNVFEIHAQRTDIVESQLNKFVLNKLVKFLSDKLNKYFETDQQRFECLYTSILLSRSGTGNGWRVNSLWLNDTFWEKLVKEIKHNIPCKLNGINILSNDKKFIYIKDSSLPLELWHLDKNISWFLWEFKTNEKLCREAIRKIGLNKFCINDLLDIPEIYDNINQWLSKNKENSYQFLDEFSKQYDSNHSDGCIQNFKNLKLWWFENEVYSISELINSELSNYLLNISPIHHFIDYAIELGIKVCDIEINKYPIIKRFITKKEHAFIDYLNDYERLINLLNDRFKLLANRQTKVSIFKILETYIFNKFGVGGQRIIRLISIFRNKLGEIKPLHQLTNYRNLPLMLRAWQVEDLNTQDLELDQYFSNTLSNIYKNIIKTNWNDICRQENQDSAARLALFAFVHKCYRTNIENGTLIPGGYFFSRKRLSINQIYHPSLDRLSDQEYSLLEEIIEQAGYALPQHSLLKFYSSDPFVLKPIENFDLDILKFPINIGNCNILLNWVKNTFPNTISKYKYIKDDNDKIQIQKLSNVEKNYITKNLIIENFINKYLKNNLFKIPAGIASNFNEGILMNTKIIEYLLQYHGIDKNLNYDLAKIVLEFGNDELKLQYIRKVGQVKVSIQLERDTFEYILLQIIFSISNEANRFNCIETCLYIESGNDHIRIGDIQSRGTDNVSYQSLHGKTVNLSISSLTGNKEINNNNAILDEFSHVLSNSGIASLSLIKQSLGIHNEQNTEDVLQSMIDRLVEHKITNATQLYFILTNRYENIIQQYSFKVETKAGWVCINNISFYLEDLDFIPSNRKLTQKYVDLFSFIGGDHLTGNNFGCNIYRKPFINDGNLVMPSIQIIDKNYQASFLIYIYELWNVNQLNHIQIIDGNVKWMSLIGFNPYQYILSDDFCLPKESTPDKIRYQKDFTLCDSFLLSIGVNNSESDVVLTRKYFVTGEGYFKLNLSINFIKNTLEWLSIKNINLLNRDIYPFFNQIHTVINSSEYFPGFIPDKDGIYLIKIDSANVFYLSTEAKNDPRFIKYCSKLYDISEKINISIIDISELLLWSNTIKNSIKQLRIDWDDIDIEKENINVTEFNYSYYTEFIERYPNHRIYKISSMEIPKKIKINDKFYCHYFNGKVCVLNTQNFVNIYTSFYNVEELIIYLSQNQIIHSAVVNGLNRFYTKFKDKLNGFIEIAKNDVDFDKYISDKAEQLKLKQERSENARIVNNHENIYSVAWFKNLLELVKTNQKINHIPKITFWSFKHVKDNIFELYNSDRIMPSNIESYSDLPVEIFYSQNNDSSSYNTYFSASIKHNKLWVLFADYNATRILLNEKNKIEQLVVKILQETDIIEELRTGFNNLNLPENVDLRNSLTENIYFIYGPPGTGKTTLLAKNLINSFTQALGVYKILLTPTNKAADVISKKIIEQNNGYKPEWLIRTGSCTDPFLLDIGAFQKSDQIFLNQHQNYLIITTIHRFSYLTVRKLNNPNISIRLCNIKWNEVLFDESSMIPLPYIVYSIYAAEQRNRDTRFVVAGDPKQIPPVFEIENEDLDEFSGDELKEYNIYKMIDLNSFDPKIQNTILKYGNQIKNLSVQHRSIPAIGSLFGKFQYNDLLDSSRGTNQNPRSAVSRKLPNGFDRLGIKPITIIRYPVRSIESIYKPSKIERSPIHIYSALIVNELIKHFKKSIHEQAEVDRWTIGVISPYRSQADLMSKMIENQSYQNNNVVITTDTVHGFQGDENNIIISVFNPSGNGQNIGHSRFLKKEYILNVAISRAEDYLIMLMPDTKSDGWHQLPELSSIVNLSRDFGNEIFAEINSSDIEQKLKRDNHYFSKNTFSSAHQKVNIYGKPNLPFMIRLGDNTIDLHWEDE